MTPVVACMVCAQPLDTLLTNGLHAGVLVMALVALGVIAALGRGAMRLLREDRAAEGSLPLPYIEPGPCIEPTSASGVRRDRG